ncbi:PREDICTED: uncharacterized protein LOC104611767 isoform X2 [Nelumbo nucifera]|uniref:Uncharacterized protein LOC104611767 isoform X2 n=1 Tax=Nelumbo nucifera TaxID=4432 RepID=A0A1U8BJJ5_NELNU|nr:PREDICTED: uncharacterized protein LOC104611767 isoform X2 [Nelumbo nucifera]
MKDNQKMAGNNPKGSSHKSSSSSSNRKSRWESGNTTNSDHNPGAAGNTKSAKPSSVTKEDAIPGPSKSTLDPIPPSGLGPFPSAGPATGAPLSFSDPAAIGPPPPAYGFHMLERRTIVLADGSVRSYFALPPDYQDFPTPIRPLDIPDRFLPLGPGGHGPEPGGLGLGFDKHFPPVGPMSPEGLRRDRNELYGRGGQQDYWNHLGLDDRGPSPLEGSLKRKYTDEDERGDFARQRQHLSLYGNPNSNSDFLAGTSSPFRRVPLDSGRGMDDLRSSKHMRAGGDFEDIHSRRGAAADDGGLNHPDVDENALKKAFLRFAKSLNENASQRKNYLEDGKQGPLQCLACGRISKDFPDMHALIMHTYNSQSADLRVDHLGLHKALCVLMGWNYKKPPENSKVYQSLSADEAAANKDDLIMWPPVVIIHNTNTGKGKEGRMEGMGNKSMDNKLRDLGFGGGKSKSLYGKDGHLGITLVKFAADQSGLKEAVRLAEYFEKEGHGRKGWTRVQSSQMGKDDENNPNLVKVDEKSGEKKRIFYGYLGTASDLDKVDFDTRKRAVIESRREFKPF